MNYTELVTASKSYADRQDIEVQDNIDVFIILAESRINRVLKTREQSTRAYSATVTDQEYYSLPPDYAGMRAIQLNSDLPTADHSAKSMEYLTPNLFNEFREQPFSGNLYYTVIANQIQIYPVQNAGKSIEMVYYQKVPNLNSDDLENWLSISHPDIYLSGMVAEIELFAKNYDVAKGWQDRMSQAIAELDNSDSKELWSGTPLYTKIDFQPGSVPNTAGRVDG